MVKVLDRESINRMTRNSGRGGSTYVGGGGGGGYTLPLAADGTRGGVQIGYTTNATNRNYAVQLSNEKMYVNVPWQNTWRPLGTGANDACAGNDYRLSNARPASDVYSWAKAATKPSYNLDEVADGTTRKLRNYLPLAGGTMTGTLKVATGYGISDATDNGLLCYHPTDWTGVTSSQWGVGAIDSVGVIRSSNNALKHYRYNDGTYEIIDSKGGQTIANSLQIASVKIEQTNEVNSYQGALHLNYRVASDVTACIGGGNFGIGTTSPGHKLHVVGRIYCTGGFAFLSDIRKKDVITKDLHISVGDIAKAPLIRYTLKSDEKKEIHIGSVAQYWQKVMPETINKSNDDTLSMDYGTISLVSVVTLARKLETLEIELSDIKKKLITK